MGWHTHSSWQIGCIQWTVKISFPAFWFMAILCETSWLLASTNKKHNQPLYSGLVATFEQIWNAISIMFWITWWWHFENTILGIFDLCFRCHYNHFKKQPSFLVYRYVSIKERYVFLGSYLPSTNAYIGFSDHEHDTCTMEIL